MSIRYEKTFAPSETLSDFGAQKMGIDIEWPIWMHYLHVTKAAMKPGVGNLTDWRDNSVASDYIKLLVERHAPNIDEKRLRADSRIADQLPVPDISTYQGRYVPPRRRGGGIEDTSRSEYYEIKPNSDPGEDAGVEKLRKIEESYKRYGLHKTYDRGITYPEVSPDYIPLKWSEAFEYLRLVFMWENNLKTCDVDLQVIRKEPGLILYAIRIRLELDVELAKAKLAALAAGVMVALAACAAAEILELAIGIEGLLFTAELLQELQSLRDQLPAGPPPRVRVAPDPPRVRVAPDPPQGPRVAEPEPTPQELPQAPQELDEEVPHEDVVIPRLRKALGIALIGRGLALPKKKYDLYCDEDYFQNVILDRTVANNFAKSMRVGAPYTLTMIASATYLQMAVGEFMSAVNLLDRLAGRYPNQCKLRIGKLIPDMLRAVAYAPERVMTTVTTQVLVCTSAIAAFIEPELRANNRRRVDKGSAGLGRGKIALPDTILAGWNGADAASGSLKRDLTQDEVVARLLGASPSEMSRKYLKDALAQRAVLKHGLDAGPGFTLALGMHGLYSMPTGNVSDANRAGELRATNVSRLFAVTAKDGAGAPGDPYALVDPSKLSSDSLGSGERFRYLGRLKY